MIAATMCVHDDVDIVVDTVRNLRDQGIDQVWVRANGAAYDALRDVGRDNVWVTQDALPQFHQSWRMDELASLAAEFAERDDPLEWIVPCDADEFWSTLGGHTVADTLRALPRTVGKVYATLWHHQTWDDKVVPAERLPKVAYRWHPDARIHMGNHDVDMPAGLDSVNTLVIRHFQYRSEEQFRRKVATWCERLPAEDRAKGYVSHLTRYDGASDAELSAAWRALCARPTVHDPIPYQR